MKNRNRKPIPKISPKRRKLLAEYNEAKTLWWDSLTTIYGPEVPCCWPGCGGNAEPKKPHHVFGRLGSLLCDDRTFRPICGYHHNLIHNDAGWAAAARVLGILATKGWWNRNPFEVTR